jgi:succinate dehydrogenase/fumarate reductase flavoprotein subunit
VPCQPIITVNAGGRLYQISVTTLISSGAGFFGAMLGSTGAALSGGDFAQVTPRASKRLKTADAYSMNNTPNDVRSIFVDRDPDVFADLLYNALPPEAETDFAKLKKLRREAEFFVYDALIQVCNDQLEAHCQSFA